MLASGEAWITATQRLPDKQGFPEPCEQAVSKSVAAPCVAAGESGFCHIQVAIIAHALQEALKHQSIDGLCPGRNVIPHIPDMIGSSAPNHLYPGRSSRRGGNPWGNQESRRCLSA